MASNLTSGLRFRMTNVLLSEQELSIQIAYFDVVIVSAMNLTLWSATNTHESECFDIFATKSTSTNHKSVNSCKLFLHLSAKNLDLVIVSTICRGSINWTFRKCFKNIIMEPLFQWAILSSKLDNFLSNNTTKKCCLGTNRTCRVSGSVFNNIFVDFFNKVQLFFFRFLVNLFS